ncbi:MAG: RNA-guided endonuclease IscB [Solirubrobacteraceae bacterium]|nr:RNA-guided endonuclease IscB [Solirubrobacteraceae bacterium]
MQTLKPRNTYTPPNASQVRCNCDLSLNREDTLSVASLKTGINLSDVNQLRKERQNLRVSVYVLNMRGYPLMPTTPRKARLLLKGGKAKVVRRTPFTIQLTSATGETNQDITLGIDSGYEHIGISALTETKELYSAEVQLRTDLVKLNSERRQYRRARRNQNTWYRQARFDNRKKPEGWLAPSIQHKLDSHLKLINKVKEFLPISRIDIEVAAFDIQKIKNPDISGTEYQNGVQKDSWNVREYVLHRDNHTCQACHGRSKDPILETHHIISRQIGGNSPENLLTLCQTCHKKVSKGKLKLDIKLPVGFKPETFMSIVRWKLVNILREAGNIVTHTYGYITKSNRLALGIEKSHGTDAFIIAGGTDQIRARPYIGIQTRRNNRALQTNRIGFKPSIRRKRYNFQPRDLVQFNSILYMVKGVFNYGSWIRLVDSFGAIINTNIKNVELTKYGKGLQFGF